jgi:uncharacterized membrane protein YedE/YeeE
MTDFTPWSALIGGALIGLSASLLLLATGQVAGISGIVAGMLTPRRGDLGWRAAFVGGLLLAGAIAAVTVPERLGDSPVSLPWLAAAGLLVGAGTRLGGGCTSGHGVCGISRLSMRSLIATAVFVATGIATVAAMHWLGSAA